MPVMISRSGRCPWRTRRRRPASVLRSACRCRKSPTSASTACVRRACAPLRKISVSESEGPWLRKLENVSVDHGVSLLRWRSGGVEHPHDTPPYPFMPSPTFAHSSQGFREREYIRLTRCVNCHARQWLEGSKQRDLENASPAPCAHRLQEQTRERGQGLYVEPHHTK